MYELWEKNGLNRVLEYISKYVVLEHNSKYLVLQYILEST